MKKLFVIMALLACVLTGHAQLLWKVSGNGLQKSSYVFGTHHMAPLSICDSIKGFEQAFRDCEQLYGEVLMDSANNAVFQQLVLQNMWLPQDSLLDILFTPEEYHRVGEALKEYLKADIEQVKMLKPSILSVQMGIAMTLRDFPDFNPQIQLDNDLQKRAYQEGKEVKGLETMQSQFELLFGESFQKQAKSMLEALKVDVVTFSKLLAKFYMQQRIEDIFTTLTDPKWGYDKESQTRMFDNRNVNWVGQLKAILPQKPTFIVVGIGHLPGERGLLNLLREQGYVVEPVM